MITSENQISVCGRCPNNSEQNKTNHTKYEEKCTDTRQSGPIRWRLKSSRRRKENEGNRGRDYDFDLKDSFVPGGCNEKMPLTRIVSWWNCWASRVNVTLIGQKEQCINKGKKTRPSKDCQQYWSLLRDEGMIFIGDWGENGLWS